MFALFLFTDLFAFCLGFGTALACLFLVWLLHWLHREEAPAPVRLETWR